LVPPASEDTHRIKVHNSGVDGKQAQQLATYARGLSHGGETGLASIAAAPASVRAEDGKQADFDPPNFR
jgi:hypothetical protein